MDHKIISRWTTPYAAALRGGRGGVAFQLRASCKTQFRHNTGGPPSPRPITFRARPALFTVSFLLAHQALATLALAPAYLYFSTIAPGGGTALLAGPAAAWALHQRVPWGGEGRTVEDVVEGMLRRGTVSIWGVTKGWRARGSAKREDAEEEGAEDTVGGALKGALSGGLWKRKKAQSDDAEIAGEVIGTEKKGRFMALAQRLKDGRQGATGQEVAEEVVDELEGKGKPAWRETVLDRASGLRMRQVVDFAAAYIVVKALFPVRLGASLWLAPRLARAAARLFR